MSQLTRGKNVYSFVYFLLFCWANWNVLDFRKLPASHGCPQVAMDFHRNTRIPPDVRHRLRYRSVDHSSFYQWKVKSRRNYSRVFQNSCFELHSVPSAVCRLMRSVETIEFILKTRRRDDAWRLTGWILGFPRRWWWMSYQRVKVHDFFFENEVL